MIRVRPAIKNLVLAALPGGEYERLSPHLEFTTLPLGQSLYRSGDVIEHVYFPGDALVSLVTHMRDGATVEAGLIGRDGMTGVPVLLGDGILNREGLEEFVCGCYGARGGDGK